MIKRYLLAAAFAALPMPAVHAQPKTTRIVVSFTSGGPVDAVARTLSERLGKELGRTVLIDNKPGANGAIGAVDVMKSAPDGSTLWFTSVGAAAINSSLYEKLPYDMQRDFVPVSLVVNNVELLVAQQGNPARDAAEFVAATKKRADPTPMGSSGTGSIPHLAIEQLADASGAKLLHVPYKGAAPAITDLMGGQISGFFGDVPGLLGHLQGGRLKALGVASGKRHPSLPEVKTLEEQGIQGVDTNNWYALFAPAKTPPEIVAAVNKAVRRTLADPAVREKLLKTGTEPVGSTPQELAAIQKRDTEKWAKLIRAKNIRAE
ncbi:tripartite-type tricarboxylate transporter receptor subunit TctC [Variovorax beijingensis]|uniref:Tripartite-type tricarboxylate transporter receptor subunit TctC n=2 Tax=Variovorax TaxID=34072 RepID=A0AAE4C154_VARPD|nr:MULTISPECIES: tripartite tricarboxylate transporter substrate binding protein [Variovorax]MDP9968094.1 tripartite-type tricarboxylate transporter receptor subunit TctC [Variovorax paradoxus]MDR6429829.1 tripartite-type tricarboxylate transporter receptor subunit TctC [Variovorax paradoxus]MDR6456210.1 tripartite-type tricarboxylate transporter receptor subunit TctC [Variovorax paradoxus]TWD73560.1 tripartite-type tricarboxylate transporter receptor subunit TctC [Variovorax beijingensis]